MEVRLLSGVRAGGGECARDAEAGRSSRPHPTHGRWRPVVGNRFRKPGRRQRRGFDSFTFLHAPLAQPGQSRGLLLLGPKVRILHGVRMRYAPDAQPGLLSPASRSRLTGRAPDFYSGLTGIETSGRHCGCGGEVPRLLGAPWRRRLTGQVPGLSIRTVRVRTPSALRDPPSFNGRTAGCYPVNVGSSPAGGAKAEPAAAGTL